MTEGDLGSDPFTIVASALHCHREALNLKSAMHRTHGWDSFGHLEVVLALERAFEISISNDEILQLTDMTSIVTFYNHQVQAKRPGNHDVE